MRPITNWKFSDATARIDLRRICGDAECVFGHGGLVRFQVDGQTLTFASVGLLKEFDTHAPLNEQLKLADVPRFPITYRTHLSIEFGALGVDVHNDDLAARWYLLPGDHVGTLAARKEVVVEVF